MPPETSKEPSEGPAQPPSSAAGEGAKSQPSPAAPATAPHKTSRRRLILGVVALVVLVAGFYYEAPAIWRLFNTVSTDDAYVNGHVTFVAPRVPGQVTKVLVDDNYRVRKGSLLVQLDKEPYRIQLDLKKAALEHAEAQLVATTDQVRGQISLARSNRFKLQHEIESVDNQIALLRADVAAWQTKIATRVRAKADFDRAIELMKTPGAISPQDVDQRREAFGVAQAQETQALETVYQVRVGLGLPAKPTGGDTPEALSEVPPNLDQNYSTVRMALSALLQSAAPLSVFPSSYNLSPQEVLAEFYKRDPQGDVDRIYKKIIEDSPDIALAIANRDQAQNDLDQAQLNLQYCDIVSEIDGVVTRRNVNPGNNVQAGEGLMAVRSLTEIWVDCNFKETQLDYLRIGQPADLEVDMYGSHKTFHGKITGFTMGTGSTLALLPAENATGNFIKVVQRLPVRIDLTDYDPDKDTLFVGLSVVPYVYYKEGGTGADAGKMLQPVMTNLPIIDPDKLRSVPPPKAAAPPSPDSKAGNSTRPAP
jgi:membrane fusion protein (multidrug efflux system)